MRFRVRPRNTVASATVSGHAGAIWLAPALTWRLHPRRRARPFAKKSFAHELRVVHEVLAARMAVRYTPCPFDAVALCSADAITTTSSWRHGVIAGP